MVLLLVLSLLVLAASAFVVTRARFDSRAEYLLACTMIWNFAVLVPIHLLGLLNRLTPAWLASAVIVECALLIGVSFWRVERREHLREVGRTALAVVRLPWEALRETVRERSFTAIGLIACTGIVAYTIWLSYLLPSDSWDGLWYHELMVGYAMQNHGYAPIALPTEVAFPANMIQQANGFPRNADMTNLWFVIFSGRDLVEVVNSFAEIPLVLGSYCIARRYTAERVSAMGIAFAIATLPAVAMQLRSTYIDVHVAAFYLMSLHFCTRPAMRIRDGWFAMLALSLLIGSKSMTLASVPVLWVSAVLLLFLAHFRARKRDLFVTLGGGSLLIVTMASVCYVRNWVLFKNPLWPMSFEAKRLGLKFDGLAPIDAIVKQQGEFTVAQSYKEILKYHPPGHDFADTGAWAYGDGISFVAVPLALLALGVLVVRIVWRVVQRRRGAPAEPRDATSWNLLLVAGVLILIAAAAPKLWYPRYNIHLAAGLLFAIAWLGNGRARLAEAISAVVLVANLLFLHRASPGWGVDWEGALQYWKRPAYERDYYSASPFSITPEVAMARDRELGAGTVVAYSADVPFVFISQVWNEHYTNKLFFVPPTSTEEFLAEANRLGATWVVAGEQSALARDLRSRKTEWQPIGKVSRGYPSIAFRRL